MMSSCCTFRLKRRRAFSSDSPSCNLTSAKETTPPNRSCGTRLLLQDRGIKSSTIWNLSVFTSRENARSESKPQGKLQLARRIRIRRLHEIRGHLIISREVIDLNVLSSVVKGCGVAHQTVVRDLKSLVEMVSQIERFSGKFQPPAVLREQPARDPRSHTYVFRAYKRIAARARKPVVVAVAVLIGIPDNLGIHLATTTRRDHAGVFPSLREQADPAMATVESTWLIHPGKNKPIALIGNAVGALGAG